MSFHIYSGYNLNILKPNGLENTHTILTYRTYTESCPGTSIVTLFELNTNGKFTEIISSFSEGEAGYSINNNFYFPIKFKNGMTFLVQNADLGNMVGGDGTLNIFPYPENIGIPIERLIVETKESTQPIFDENGTELVDKNGNPKLKTIKGNPIFYEWNGISLKKQ